MTIESLKDYASNKKTNELDQSTVAFDSVDYPISSLLTVQWNNYYDEAILEKPDGVRHLIFPGEQYGKVITNAQLITFTRAGRTLYQKILDVYFTIIAQIISSTLTSNGAIDTAWTSLEGSYTNNRSMNPIFSITATAHINDGATDAATNSPTNLNVLTTLLGSLTGEVNATNAKQNALASKYNDLATKFNTLMDHLESQSLQLAS